MNGPAVPAYALYGDRPEDRFPDGLHIETISARSTVHGWRIRPHRHQDLHQLFWIDGGGGVAEVGAAAHPLAPATAIVMPPLVVHGFRFRPGTAGYVASIPARTLHRAVGDDPMLRRALGRAAVFPVDATDAAADLRALRAAAHGEFAAGRPGRDHALVAHAGLLALWFARAVGDPAGGTAPDDRRADLVRRYLDRVEADFAGERDLAVHAAALGVSVPHLSRVCRQLLGRPALAVLHDRVVLEAKRNLVYTSMTVAEVAYRLGFSDPAYFSRFFAARVGRSPSDYRSTVFMAADVDRPRAPVGSAGLVE